MTDWRETVGNSSSVMSRSGSPSQTAQQIGEKVSVENLSIPTSVRPNDRVPFSYRVRVLTDKNVLDPDWCPRPIGSLEGSGFDSSFVVSFGGQENTFTRCLDEEDAVTELSGSFFAPSQEGDYDFTIEISGRETGDVYERHTTTIEVSETSPDPGGCPDGFVMDPDTGQCVQDPSNGNGGGGDGFGLTQFVVENPVAAGVIGVGGVVVLRTATETAIGGQ